MPTEPQPYQLELLERQRKLASRMQQNESDMDVEEFFRSEIQTIHSSKDLYVACTIITYSSFSSVYQNNDVPICDFCNLDAGLCGVRNVLSLPPTSITGNY